MAASVGNNTTLLERYPELFFHLNYTPFTPHQEDLQGQVLEELHLEGVDLLYVYGIGLGHPYVALKSWLHEKRERRLIFLEEDLAVFHALLEAECAEELLLDPQVVVQFISHPSLLQVKLDELISLFPCDRIEVACLLSYRKKYRRRFQKIRLHLLRRSTLAHSLLTESLYSHKMLKHLLRNIKRWDGSFFAGGLRGKFRGIPAIICGAGPSLQGSLEQLKSVEDKALIIAGGSTIAALSNQGIYPHLGLALDPNPEEFDRLKVAAAYETPLIYATRLQPDVFNAVSGEWGYLVSDTGGPLERHFEKEMGLDSEPIGPEMGAEALSITTLAIALAVQMGCDPIFLNGIDLAYTGMQRYAEGILPSSHVHLPEIRLQTRASERMLKRKNIQGHYVYTLVKWVMESECIAAFAASHPQTRFINVSAAGLGFSGIPNIPLAEAIETHLMNPLDLRALVHAEIQRLKILPLHEKIACEMQSVQESLVRLSGVAAAMIQELERVQALAELPPLPTGKMAILEMDFQEEKAFDCLFPTLGPALDKLLSRAFVPSLHSTEGEKERLMLACKLAKYKAWQEIIVSKIAVFSKI